MVWEDIIPSPSLICSCSLLRQVGSDGHCSVEDACTAMQLYRLVEVEWEQRLHSELSTAHDHTTADTATEVSHYMDDQYWPAELNDWGTLSSG